MRFGRNNLPTFAPIFRKKHLEARLIDVSESLVFHGEIHEDVPQNLADRETGIDPISIQDVLFHLIGKIRKRRSLDRWSGFGKQSSSNAEARR